MIHDFHVLKVESQYNTGPPDNLQVLQKDLIFTLYDISPINVGLRLYRNEIII